MTTRTPSRRLLQLGGLSCLRQPQPSTHLPLQHQRTLFGFGRGRKDDSPPAMTNPILDDFLKKKNTKAKQPALVQGDLAPSSIFDAHDPQPQARDESTTDTTTAIAKKPDSTRLPPTLPVINGRTRNPASMAAVLDPHPTARERWQRKMVIREIRKGGRLTPTQYVKRTERESSSKSSNLKTSTKKLGMLARQIAGKTIDDAIVQMRFSKKLMAKEVVSYLEFARDEAVVKRGMGLGQVTANQQVEKSGVAPGSSAESASGAEQAEDITIASPQAQKIEIQLKDGKRHTVTDKSQIYISQAWVGRGPFGKLPDYRAKGQVYTKRPPWTSLSVVLKEEATRVREYEQREEKRRRQREKKVWHPLPDRPIVGQRQWFSW